MSEQRLGVLRTGFVGTCALVALVLLAVFYSTVSSAVDHAAQREGRAVSRQPRRVRAVAIQW